VRPVDEGTPQGGPLSPLLSNLMLDDLDRELTQRGHRFCLYADDCNIYVCSRRAGERVMASVSRFLTTKLRLTVNDCRGTIAIPAWVARLLRLLPDPSSAREPGSVDPPKIALISLAAVGERAQPLQRTAPPWRITVQSSSCRRFTDGLLAYVRTSGGPIGPTQPLLRFNRSSPTLCSSSSLIRSNRRGTDPYARWCGRGGAVRRPPIPIKAEWPQRRRQGRRIARS